jgi:hypothetical protein
MIIEKEIWKNGQFLHMIMIDSAPAYQRMLLGGGRVRWLLLAILTERLERMLMGIILITNSHVSSQKFQMGVLV